MGRKKQQLLEESSSFARSFQNGSIIRRVSSVHSFPLRVSWFFFRTFKSVSLTMADGGGGKGKAEPWYE